MAQIDGATTLAGPGTISSSGTAVTGTSTNFLESFENGDTIISAGQTEIVATVTSDTSLTTITAFSPTLSGATYTVAAAAVRGFRSNKMAK